VESVPEKIQVQKGAFQLPTLVSWLDKDYQTVRSEVEMPGLGKMTLFRTTKAVATKSNGGAIREIGIDSLIAVNKKIAQPYDTVAAEYRIRVKGDDNAATTFVEDGRQKVAKAKGDTFELHVQASHGPQGGDPKSKADDEFLKSSFFINCDDKKVKELARKAVGSEADPWKKALKIERWVFQNMEKKNFTEAFATADEVARTLEGDCTEHSMLSAAMCRAAGVPSRTALGLVYVDDRARGPVMGFHMWTEVWIKGQWIPIDATLGRGYVGATHLKITDHSWFNTNSLTPLLPVVRVLGKLNIEVLEVSGKN
jgi:hypothetical protein